MPLKKVASSNLKKKSSSRVSRPLTKTPGTIIFASYPRKKVDKKYIDAFWERYFNGELKKFISKRKDNAIISDLNVNVNIFPLSKSVAVTVRKMAIDRGKEYLKLKKIIDKIIKKNKFKYSEIILADIIDYKIKNSNSYILERIIPSITVKDVLIYFEFNGRLFKNRFNNSFTKVINKIPSKIVDKMYFDLEKALIEISNSSIVWNEEKLKLDFNYKNMIIIDYNPEKAKFKFGFIDLTGINSKSF